MQKSLHDPERHLRAVEDTDATVRFTVENYKKTIQQMERQAVRICK